MKKFLFELLKDNARKQIEIQSSAIESIENKTGIILGTSFGIPTIIAAIVSITKGEISINYFIIGGLTLLISSIISSIYSLSCKNFSFPADIEKFLIENNRLREEAVRINFIDDCKKAISKNGRNLKKKGILFNLALISFVLGSAILVFGISERSISKMILDRTKQESTTQKPNNSHESSGGNNSPQTNATSSGLPNNRQDTTLDIFKGGDVPKKK